MSIGGNDLIAIDTNALVHWLRQDSTGQHLLQQYALDQRAERPVLSTVVEGEIRGLARFWHWERPNSNDSMRFWRNWCEWTRDIQISSQNSADLYFEDQQGRHNTGENDLWIAATAKATGAVLLTCDADFGWLSPTLLQVEKVTQVR